MFSDINIYFTLVNEGNLVSSCSWGLHLFSSDRSTFVPNFIIFFFLLGVCNLYFLNVKKTKLKLTQSLQYDLPNCNSLMFTNVTNYTFSDQKNLNHCLILYRFLLPFHVLPETQSQTTQDLVKLPILIRQMKAK